MSSFHMECYIMTGFHMECNFGILAIDGNILIWGNGVEYLTLRQVH